MHLLQRYSWPGNVRELVNVIERAVVLSKSEIILPSDLPDSLRIEPQGSLSLGGRAGSGSLKAALVNPERQLILEALETNSWNRQETAKTLGINRTTLYKKMKRFNIDFEVQVPL
jgi:DNA-binding NtrC family response regulator